MGLIIAITGGSGSGKTTIAARVAQRLDANLIAEDDYYTCRSNYPAFDERTHNFDTPAAKDHALLASHLQAARRGEAFDKPLYDLKTHERRPQTERIEARPFLVLDGIHAFASEALRAAADLKIFVDTDEAVRLQRRLVRDVEERARKAEIVLYQFENFVRPAHAATVEPQRAFADLVIRDAGGADFAEADAHAERIAALARARQGAVRT